jgi:hypothetical protein
MAYYTNEKGELVPYTGEVPQEAIMAIESADEQTIVERLTKVDAQPVFAYSFPVKTKEGIKDIIGIGVDGAKEIANLLGNIKVSSDIKAEDRGDYIYAIVPVTNMSRNVTLLGAAGQPKYIVGEGMELTDRIDPTAFVKAISKAQRNGILAVAPQETIAEIIKRLDAKAIKKLPAPPAYGKPVPAKLKEPATEEDKLKKLRQQIGIEAGKVFKSNDERKAWQKEQYSVDSMTEMTMDQLQDMLNKIKAMQQPAKPDVTELGFSSEAEQKQMRRELFKLIDELGYKTDDEKREYITKKGWGRTNEVTKEELESYIAEVKAEIEVVEEAENISEDL